MACIVFQIFAFGVRIAAAVSADSENRLCSYGRVGVVHSKKPSLSLC